MKTYLVGGAVRDQLLGCPVKERDWVVVGATIEELIQQGFKPVGKDFPVFLHPKTGEEYALARTERKIAKGYKGFSVYTDSSVTLEDDLRRRDLTINAIAQDGDGSLIDPFHGQKDLEQRVLRHVSPAFSEDPVRILRIARFASRFGDFSVAPETMQLMRDMVNQSEADALVPERVWQELQRALSEDYPWRFFEVLRQCDALKVIFPEIDALYGVPNPEKWHPEIDSGIHTMLALQKVCQMSPDPEVRFAMLVHDLGKTETPKSEWPHHHNHAQRGVPIVKTLCQRLHVPNNYRSLAILVTRYHSLVHDVMCLKPQTLLKMLMALDPFRKPERFKKFLIACKADSQGRHGCSDISCPQIDFLHEIYQHCAQIDIPKLIQGVAPEQIAEIIYRRRLQVIKQVSRELAMTSEGDNAI